MFIAENIELARSLRELILDLINKSVHIENSTMVDEIMASNKNVSK
jgi:hypothetical protein